MHLAFILCHTDGGNTVLLRSIAAYCDTDIAYRVAFCAVFCDALVYRSGPSNYNQVIACDFDST